MSKEKPDGKALRQNPVVSSVWLAHVFFIVGQSS